MVSLAFLCGAADDAGKVLFISATTIYYHPVQNTTESKMLGNIPVI
jgi:hypothetical protein